MSREQERDGYVEKARARVHRRDDGSSLGCVCVYVYMCECVVHERERATHESRNKKNHLNCKGKFYELSAQFTQIRHTINCRPFS